MKDNVLSSVYDNCIDVDGGTSHVVTGNSCTSSGGYGVNVSGNGSLIATNTMTYMGGYECYNLSGNDLRVERNMATACYGGYYISGQNPRVLNNRVEQAGDYDGFYVYCSTSCSSGFVQGNYASGVNNDDNGFDITITPGSGAGFRVTGNIAEYNIQVGFELSMSDAVITGNRATGNGSEGDAGFQIWGNNNQITSNTANNNENDGFYITGNGNTLASNTATGNLGDGFEVRGSNNTLNLNVTTGNHGEGIANGTTNAVLTNNSASGNRIDCANATGIVITTNTGSRCGDGSNFALTPQVDY